MRNDAFIGRNDSASLNKTHFPLNLPFLIKTHALLFPTQRKLIWRGGGGFAIGKSSLHRIIWDLMVQLSVAPTADAPASPIKKEAVLMTVIGPLLLMWPTYDLALAACCGCRRRLAQASTRACAPASVKA
jgi:hypothetical protein